MRILITGVCGFVGSALARFLRAHRDEASLAIVGIDNFARAGSEINRRALADDGITVLHGDVRLPTDIELCGEVDWVIDAAANPSVLAGTDGQSSSRQVIDHNLIGTINLVEYCKAHRAGLVLLSTSRVYSIAPLAALSVRVRSGAFEPVLAPDLAAGLSAAGIAESFPTTPPVSLYGVTKLASEAIALEYHHTFGVPVWINRCGVLAGAGQFGHATQGIFSFWLNAHLRRAPLRYIGFGGHGHQVRDCLHPLDLGALILRQMEAGDGSGRSRLANVAGGVDNSISLLQLTEWCDARFGKHDVATDHRPRPFDVPWMVLDSTAASSAWGWSPQIRIESILEEIALHAEKHADWLRVSGGT